MGSLATLVARPNCKLVLNAPPKLKGWRFIYVFMEVPEDFLIPGRWILKGCFRDPVPVLREEQKIHVKAMRCMPPLNARYAKLMSAKSLAEVRLCTLGLTVRKEEMEALEILVLA